MPDRDFIRSHQLLPRIERVEPDRTALLVIDMQVGFLEPGSLLEVPAAAAILPNVNRLIDSLREAGAMIVLTRHTIARTGFGALPAWLQADGWNEAVEPLLQNGARAHAIHSDVRSRPDDCLVDKFRASAFNPQSSALDSTLRAAGVDTIIVVGCITNICCESTARDGHMLGYRTIVVSDAMAARTQAEHDASLLNLSAAFADVQTTRSICELAELSCIGARNYENSLNSARYT